MLNYLGWIATSVFCLSYFCTRPSRLRLVQASGAILWIAYGFLIMAPPVIVANLIVAVVALYSAWKSNQPKSSWENTTSPRKN